MQAQSESADEQSKSVSKPPVVRNARACTVCRTAKMKCVGAEDGQKPCQRCKRTGAECIFEKHRRGRKPGSKLSEASKMLRRLEKGLNAAKLKQVEASTSPVYAAVESRSPQGDAPFSAVLQPLDQYGSSGSRLSDGDDDEDGDRSDERFPAKMIRKENSFFRTILNPEPKSPYHATALPHTARSDHEHNPSRPSLLPDGYDDPISAGLITEEKCHVLLDLIMLRLNPFINLFDPALHSLEYVRSRCPFLFTTLMMAGCKFFEPAIYKDCLRLAHELAVCAFSNAWKRVEVVQAFACLTYWREQEDNRTWMYIGFACRMAVELGLNRFVAKPPPNETEFQLRERRNRERTYLVLFVHDRSLSMQTGRHWMLPEDDFIRHSDTWHTHSTTSTPCQDVVAASFAQLRRIAAETTDMLHINRSVTDCGTGQASIDIALKNANAKLGQWSTRWEGELRKANGEPFHFSFLTFFRLYTSLFLNSFGVQDHVPQVNRTNSHLRALSACFDTALNVLHVASKEFKELGILQYGQETTCVMTAYSAIFLLRLLRNSYAELPEGAATQIHDFISRTADAYNTAAQLSPTSSSANYHARFLWHLLRTRSGVQPTLQLDPVLQGSTISAAQPSGSPSDDIRPVPQSYYPVPPAQDAYPPREQPNAPTVPLYTGATNRGAPAMSVDYTQSDFNYYRNMLFELGFGENEQMVGSSTDQFRNASYGDTITAHYTQYPYPQPMVPNDFPSS